MSLPAPLGDVIPEQTIQVARAAFPTGHPARHMRDALGPLYTNPPFAPLFSRTGRPAAAPAQLALIPILPFAEGLSDVQAADAVRAPIDWKDALALELTTPGFDASVLCEFRQRLITGQAARLRFETMLTRFHDPGWLKAKGRQRTDSMPVLAALQTLTRLECLGDTLRHALNVLAPVAPDWLQSWVPAVWCDRYRQRFADDRVPPAKPARDPLATQIGRDGRQRLWAIDEPATPAWLREVPALQTLPQVWRQQFYASPNDQPVRWRHADDLPPAPLLISSLDDPAARYGKTRETEWTGDTGHLTEPCDDETPHRLTDGLTTPATTPDVAVLPTIQAHLAPRQVTPRDQVVDAGDVSADHLLRSRTAHGSDLRGPVPDDQSWQGQAAHGFAAAQLLIDWDATHAICPPGQRSVVWMERPDRHGHPPVRIAFRKPGCVPCASRADGTRAAIALRALRIRARDHNTVLQAARARQQTDAVKKAYARRAGVEGTIAQGTRPGELRRSRSMGFVKTQLMHVWLAAAINFTRAAAWFMERPRARTRPSAVAALAAAPAR